MVKVFELVSSVIESPENQLLTNQALAHVADGLAELGLEGERGKKKAERVKALQALWNGLLQVSRSLRRTGGTRPEALGSQTFAV